MTSTPANIKLGRRNAAADAFGTIVDPQAPCGDGSVQPAVRCFSANTNGIGSRANLIGTGGDDFTDALDRCVVFAVIDC